MTPKYLLNDKGKYLSFIGLLIVINLTVIALTDLETSRLTRLISIGIFFAYYLIKKELLNLWTVITFLFFIGRDIFFQFYEELKINYK